MSRKKSKRKPPKPSRKAYHPYYPTAQEIERQELEIISAFRKVMLDPDKPDALPDTRLWTWVMGVWALEHTIASGPAPGRAPGAQQNWAKAQYMTERLRPLLEIVEDRAGISPGQLETGNIYAGRRVWRKIAAAERKAKAEGVSVLSGLWSPPLTLAAIADRIFGNREMRRKVRSHYSDRLHRINRQSYQMRLDGLDQCLQDLLKRP